MINPETVRKLKLLKELVDKHGNGRQIVDFNQIIIAFTKNNTLTRAEAVQANKIYKKLKSFTETSHTLKYPVVPR